MSLSRMILTHFTGRPSHFVTKTKAFLVYHFEKSALEKESKMQNDYRLSSFALIYSLPKANMPYNGHLVKADILSRNV